MPCFFTKKTSSLLAFSRPGYILNAVSSGASPSSRGLGHQVLILVTWVRIPLGMPFFWTWIHIFQYFSFLVDIELSAGMNQKGHPVHALRRKNTGGEDRANDKATHSTGKGTPSIRPGSKAKKTHCLSPGRESVLKKKWLPVQDSNLD